jgi:hypothetical protein
MSTFFLGGWLMAVALIAFEMARSGHSAIGLIVWAVFMFAGWAVTKLSERNKP